MYDIRVQLVFVVMSFLVAKVAAVFFNIDFIICVALSATSNFLFPRACLPNIHFSRADLRPLWLSVVVAFTFSLERESVYVKS